MKKIILRHGILFFLTVVILNTVPVHAVVWPDDTTWPTAAPEDMGMSSQLLADAPGKAVTSIGTAIVIRNGYDVWHYGGDPYSGPGDWWASVMRTFMTTLFGMLIHRGVIQGGESSVEMSVNQLPSATAQSFSSDVKLKHLLSYTVEGHPSLFQEDTSLLHHS